MDMNTIILAGAVGFFGSTIKSAPSQIVKLVKYLFGYNISVSSNNSRSYNRVNDYIMRNLKSKVIKRKAKFGHKYEDCMEKSVMSLGLGRFYIFENKTIYLINHYKETKKNFEEYQLEVSIIGKRAKEVHSKMIDHSMAKTESGKIGIRFGYTYKSVNSRSLDTIYCNGNVKEDIIREIDDFNRNKLTYKENGIPYRIGILLHGKPGTGKTSMVRAIATYTKRDINVINLNDLQDLRETISKVSENDILLIEEIDTIVANRDDNSKVNIELGNLLNLLDGVGTPENIIVIATTNHIDRLDDALIREGRFDIKKELGYLSKLETEEVLKKKGMVLPSYIEFPVAPSKLQLEILKQIKKQNTT